MPRSVVLGNGETLVALDKFGQVRDWYFPYVGMEDHVRGHYIHRLGVWIDGKTSWFGEDKNWQIDVKAEENALASSITAINRSLEVSVILKDLVYNEHSIFLREIIVTNTSKKSREIKFYLAHQFELSKSHGADTAFFDPKDNVLIHYKGQRVFLINGEIEGLPFSDYTTGLSNYNDLIGSHIDAEDGHLSKNPIEHGPVDSVMGFYGFYSGNDSKTINYWVCSARFIPEAKELNYLVLKKTPKHIIKSTSDFWKAWVNKYEFNFYKLSPEIISLFKKSLMIIRAHVDNGGAIIASADSDMLNQGKDTYAYMWPRDAAFSASALDRAGDQNVSRKFFEFCKNVMSNDGYLMHKYLPDKSLGSSWHPYIRDGEFQLPIQEDETAIVIWALYQHYLRTHDIEFIESLYNDMVEKAANFMMEYRDKKTNLPKPSYDLWEEKYGVSTYSSSAVYGALIAGAEFSKLLGKTENEMRYRKGAEEIKEAILSNLYDEETGNFLKLIFCKNKVQLKDKTIDISSVFGVFLFGVLPVKDAKLLRAMEQTHKALTRNISGKGIARYDGDGYYRILGDTPGNPWFISTLWYAQYLIAKSQTEKDFGEVREYLEWATKRALSSGVLSEQINPFNGEQVAASPLVWSHAEFVNTVLKYLDRAEELGLCVACNPVP